MDLEQEIQQLQIQFNNIIVQTQQIKDTQRLMQDNYNNLFNNINSTLQTISSRLSSMTPTTELDKKITAIERRLNVFSDDTSQELLNTTKTHRSDVDKINTRIDNMKSEVVSSLNNEVYNKSEVFNINETYNKNQIDTLVTNQINKTKQEIKNYTTQGYSKNETYTRSEIDSAISDAEDLLTNKFDAMYYTKSDLYNKTELNTKFDGKANINHGIHVPTLLNDNTKFLCSDNTWQSITTNNIDAYTKLEANTKFVDKTDFTNELNTKANVNHGIHVPTLANDNNKYLRSDNTWQTIIQSNSYSKTDSDAKYALKIDTYNKFDIDGKLNEKASINHGIHVPVLANDLNKFLRSDNTWQTITANMVNGYTKSEADAKYALKSDTYTQADVDTKLNEKANVNHGIHVPTLENNNNKYLRSDNTWQTIAVNNVDAYTKLESDTKYALKSDIIDKTTLYTKNDVYNKLESDNKYALQVDAVKPGDVYKKSELYTKNDVYSKSESDTKYALISDIIDKTTLYTKDDVYSKAEADTKYALKSDVIDKTTLYTKNDVYSKSESDAKYAVNTDIQNQYVKKTGDTLSGTLSFDKTVEKPIKGMFNDTDEYGIEINKDYKVMTIYNKSTAVGSSIRVYNPNGYADLVDNQGNTMFTGQVKASKGFLISGYDAQLTFAQPTSSQLNLVNKDYGLLINGNGIKTKKMIITNPNNSDDNTNTMSVNTDGQIEINNTNGIKSQKFIGNLQGNADSATMINNTKLIFSNGTEMWIG